MPGLDDCCFSNNVLLKESSVASLFEKTVRKYPNNPFVSFKNETDGGFRDISYQEFNKKVLALRETYRAAGYTVGHRVGLMANNHPLFYLHYLALNGLGVSIVPLNPDAFSEESLYLIEHSGVVLIVTLASSRSRVNEIAALAPVMPTVYLAEDFPSTLPVVANKLAIRAPDQSTETTVLYTSGTTGKPKGCILTNEYFLVMAAIYTTWGGRLRVEEGQERLLNPLPLFHINHLVLSTTSMIATGGCNVLIERFSPSRWLDDCKNSESTLIHYLGVMPAILLSLPKQEGERQHKIKAGVGAGVDPLHHQEFEDRFGFPLLELWGMTEVGAGFIDSTEPRSVGTRAFGRPQGAVKARVVDDEMNDVPVGSPGQLLVQSATDNPRFGFFRGYLKDERATEAVWYQNWFCTGDIVRQDESGRLYFVDRIKNIIRRSGENISAAEVESCLSDHPDVIQVVVLPVPDPIREQEVLACIQLKEDIMASKDLAHQLHGWVMERLSYFKTPGYISFIEEIPTTGTHKVRKDLIFKEVGDPLALPMTFDLRDLKKRNI